MLFIITFTIITIMADGIITISQNTNSFLYRPSLVFCLGYHHHHDHHQGLPLKSHTEQMHTTCRKTMLVIILVQFWWIFQDHHHQEAKWLIFCALQCIAHSSGPDKKSFAFFTEKFPPCCIFLARLANLIERTKWTKHSKRKGKIWSHCLQWISTLPEAAQGSRH